MCMACCLVYRGGAVPKDLHAVMATTEVFGVDRLSGQIRGCRLGGRSTSIPRSLADGLTARSCRSQVTISILCCFRTSCPSEMCRVLRHRRVQSGFEVPYATLGTARDCLTNTLTWSCDLNSSEIYQGPYPKAGFVMCETCEILPLATN